MEYGVIIIGLGGGLILGYLIAYFQMKSKSAMLEERIINFESQKKEEADRSTLLLKEADDKLDKIQSQKEEELREEREKSAGLDRP